jgi:hypothetical protein
MLAKHRIEISRIFVVALVIVIVISTSEWDTTKVTVDPIRRMKDNQTIAKLLSDSPRNHLLFVMVQIWLKNG